MKTNLTMIQEFKFYKPESKYFTSDFEMEQLKKHFEMEQRSYLDLQNLRDMVVLVYTGWMEEEREKGNDGRDYMSAMQSITSVIDHYKYSKL